MQFSSLLFFLALVSLANANFFGISPGDFSNLTFSETASASYTAQVANLLFDGSVTTAEASFYQDNTAQIFYYSQPGLSYYFLPNGTYVISGETCDYEPGNGYDYVVSLFDQTLQSSKFTFVGIPYAIQYSGRVNLGGFGNSITITIDPVGFLLAADFDGVNSPDEVDGIVRASYAITGAFPLSNDGTGLPPIPAECF